MHLETSTNIDKARQRLGAIRFRLPRQLHTTSETGNALRLGAGTHPHNHLAHHLQRRRQHWHNASLSQVDPVDSGRMQNAGSPRVGIAAVLDRPQIGLSDFQFVGFTDCATLCISLFSFPVGPASLLSDDQPFRRCGKKVGDLSEVDPSL
ncbi:MAG: hypothetical protein QOI28_3765 [Mycobacterium sp.]|nr:hypothetical protein [Mycobacterium sp.]